MKEKDKRHNRVDYYYHYSNILPLLPLQLLLDKSSITKIKYQVGPQKRPLCLPCSTTCRLPEGNSGWYRDQRLHVRMTLSRSLVPDIGKVKDRKLATFNLSAIKLLFVVVTASASCFAILVGCLPELLVPLWLGGQHERVKMEQQGGWDYICGTMFPV